MKCSICVNEYVTLWCSKKGYSVFRCDVCQFLFAPVVSTLTKEYYGEDYLHNSDGKGGYVNYELDKMPMCKTFENVLATIKTASQGRRLLDAGTANGYFLDIAKKHGFEAEGFDINKLAVEDAFRRGRNVNYGDIFGNLYKESSFDVITAFDFFEHIPHDYLEELMQILYYTLVRGGILVMITVNSESLWARLFGKRWHTLLPPEHVSFFNKHNIALLLNKNGFKVLEIRTINKTFSLQYLFNILALWQGIAVWKKITRFLEKHPRLGTASLCPYIGDNMLVIARKL